MKAKRSRVAKGLIFFHGQIQDSSRMTVKLGLVPIHGVVSVREYDVRKWASHGLSLISVMGNILLV